MVSEVGLLDETLKRINFVCCIGGLDLKNENNFIKKFVYVSNFIWLNLDLSGSVFYIFDGLWRGEEFIILTYGTPCVTFSYLANFKSLSIVMNGDRLYNLFEALRKLEKKHLAGGKNEVKDRIVQEELKFLHWLIKVLKVCYIFLTSGFTVNPIIITGYSYFLLNKKDLRLPFFILYPFDAFDMRYWPWVYLHQVGSAVVAIWWVCAVDFIFYICCTYIRIQFRLLQHELEIIITENMTKEDFDEKFREMVVWHQELINCTYALEAIFTKSILFNFVTSSVLICLTGFDVLMISDRVMVVSFVTFLSANLFQIFLLCLFGDLLMKSSVEVGDGAYNSLWYKKDASYSKLLLLVQIRSRKPCKLTAYRFADVNLTAFTRILRNAWSYFALLNTMLT